MLKISDDIEFEKLKKWGFKINKNTLPPCIYIDDDICQMYFDLYNAYIRLSKKIIGDDK